MSKKLSTRFWNTSWSVAKVFQNRVFAFQLCIYFWHPDLKGVLCSCLLFGVLVFLRRLLGKKIYILDFCWQDHRTVAAIFGVLVFLSTTFWQRYIYVGFLTIVSQNICCYFLGFWSLQVPLFGEYTFGKYIFCTFPDRITEHRRSYLLKIDIVIS